MKNKVLYSLAVGIVLSASVVVSLHTTAQAKSSFSETSNSYVIESNGYKAIIPKNPSSSNVGKVIGPSGSEVDTAREIREMSKVLGYGDPCLRTTIC